MNPSGSSKDPIRSARRETAPAREVSKRQSRGCVSAFLLYRMFVRIPTITPERVQLIRQVEKAE